MAKETPGDSETLNRWNRRLTIWWAMISLSAMIVLYMMDMGVDPRVLVPASERGEDEMHFFAERELHEYLLVNGGSSEHDFVQEADGIVWRSRNWSGDRRLQREWDLYCDLSEQAWMFRLADYEMSDEELGFDPKDPRMMAFSIQAQDPLDGGSDLPRFSFSASDIHEVNHTGEAWQLLVRLPFNVADFASKQFFFHVNSRNAWWFFLSAGGALPDANQMSILRRTCVS